MKSNIFFLLLDWMKDNKIFKSGSITWALLFYYFIRDSQVKESIAIIVICIKKIQ